MGDSKRTGARAGVRSARQSSSRSCEYLSRRHSNAATLLSSFPPPTYDKEKIAKVRTLMVIGLTRGGLLYRKETCGVKTPLPLLSLLPSATFPTLARSRVYTMLPSSRTPTHSSQIQGTRCYPRLVTAPPAISRTRYSKFVLY